MIRWARRRVRTHLCRHKCVLARPRTRGGEKTQTAAVSIPDEGSTIEAQQSVWWRRSSQRVDA